MSMSMMVRKVRRLSQRNRRRASRAMGKGGGGLEEHIP